MVDHEPGSYRPRRALVEPDPEPEAEAPAAPVAARAIPATPVVEDDEDKAKPLYREAADDADAATVRAPSATPQTAQTPSSDEPTTAGGGSSTGRPLSFVPRKARPDEEESTTLLPRTPAHRGVETADLLDDDDLGRRRPGRRAKLGLLVAGIAAVVAVGLAIAYAVTGVSGTPGSGGPPSTSTSSGTSTSASPAVLLADASMLSAAGARSIDATRTWAVAATVRGQSADAPGAACLGTDALDGAPTPQQKITRTLTSSGSNGPQALHVAQAYASAEEAGQAFTVTEKALGTCAVTGDYLSGGQAVSGAGDESSGALVTSVSGSTVTGHTVLVSRTGRFLDVIDASEPKQSPDGKGVAGALASVLKVQCTTSGGACATAVAVGDGPPPVGGDVLGYLSTGDLPPASANPAPWVGTQVETPTSDFTGSQCESTDWSLLSAVNKGSRVYLLQDVPGFFGLNEIVVTLKDADTAFKLVEKTRSDWTSCKERKLTATVSTPAKVTGVGAKGAKISGYTTMIEQKAGTTTNRYRVGIAATGNKVAFTFLNPVNGMDLTSTQWDLVTVRAVQRATQAS